MIRVSGKEISLMNRINILIFFFFLFGLINYSHGLENKIILKIDNTIITSLDVKKETRYLLALSPEMKNIESDKIYQISKNSLIRETIKNIEILKNFEKVEIEERFLDEFITQTYTKLGIESKTDFITYLKKNNLNLEEVKKKISMEVAWNKLTYLKFSSKVKIDQDNLKKIILENKQKGTKIYLLQEILFELENNTNLEKKYNLIKENIQKQGFEKTALIFSISDSSKNGGIIGWVNQNALNTNILKKITNINIGNHTNPIVIPGGFLILKIKDIKIEKKEVNIDEELSKIINIKTNQQLNQYSLIFYNKLKSNTQINEL
jgi:peptidyl-prolyl cis-trans isomerase SurA